MTKAVRKAVTQVRRDVELDDMGEALAALSVHLAKKLDEGRAVMATAAIARELRDTLDALAPGEDGDADKAFLDAIGIRLSTPG